MADDNYVIAGAWTDMEWQRAAATRNTADHAADKVAQLVYARGPRTHPYGPLAVTVNVNNEPRIYPSHAAALADGAIKADDMPKDGTEHQPAAKVN